MSRIQCSICAVLVAVCICAADVQADIYDLTGSGTGSATINDAWFFNANTATGSTGTGTIQSFLRVSTNKSIVQGYNTDYRPLEYDESASWTTSLLLTAVPTISLGGTLYREFLLDINQAGSNSMLSLDQMEFYLGNVGTLHNYEGGGLGTPIYDLGVGNGILLDASVYGGSGHGDMYAYIPDSLFVDVEGVAEYVYLYSKFGVNTGNNDGFEEWAVRGEAVPPIVPVPAPMAAILGILGLGYAGMKLRRFV